MLGSSSAKVSWMPIRVGLSADGRHGFTFGYLDSSEEGQSTKVAKYVSYWAKGADGWRVRLFKRVPRPEGVVSTKLMPPSLPSRLVKAHNNPALVEKHRASLATRERAFSDASQRIGLGPAFVKFGSSDAVNVGGTPEFVVGAATIGAGQGTGSSPLYWSADQGVLVASSGDLGVTWGYLHRNGPTPPGRLGEIPFFTIWHRNSPAAPWLYIAE
jgi:hypothetical protein